jgi:uncharacterized damage-inducible protein DinB
MYRVIDDFFKDWKYETEATLNIFKNLSQESLTQKVSPDVRSLGRLAWHITISNPQMLTHAGFKIENFDENAPVPEKLEEIINEYEKNSKLFEKIISENWKTADLTDEINMYGENWSKGKILAVILAHQTHHRAQMTIVMRLAGLKVPGVYGPSKEEWLSVGRQPEE